MRAERPCDKNNIGEIGFIIAGIISYVRMHSAWIPGRVEAVDPSYWFLGWRHPTNARNSLDEYSFFRSTPVNSVYSRACLSSARRRSEFWVFLTGGPCFRPILDDPTQTSQALFPSSKPSPGPETHTFTPENSLYPPRSH